MRYHMPYLLDHPKIPLLWIGIKPNSCASTTLIDLRSGGVRTVGAIALDSPLPWITTVGQIK